MDDKKTMRLYMRVTPREKLLVEQYAAKCGLSQSEYLRKRALGFVPKAVQPDALFDFTARLDELCNLCGSKTSADIESKLLALVDDVRAEIVLPQKEKLSQIQTSVREGGD